MERIKLTLNETCHELSRFAWDGVGELAPRLDELVNGVEKRPTVNTATRRRHSAV